MTAATDYAARTATAVKELGLAKGAAHLDVAQTNAMLAQSAALMALADAQKSYTDALVKAITAVDEGADGGNP